jgi:hypothetical protein
MGLDLAPIYLLYPRRTLLGQESAPQEECELQMTNPQPHPVDITAVPGPELVQPASSAANAAQADSLMEEIRVLRERGLSNECIHGLFSGFNIDARPEPSGQHWNLPINDQLIRLIWGRALPSPKHLD